MRKTGDIKVGDAVTFPCVITRRHDGVTHRVDHVSRAGALFEIACGLGLFQTGLHHATDERPVDCLGCIAYED